MVVTVRLHPLKSKKSKQLYSVIFRGKLLVERSGDPECDAARALLIRGFTGKLYLSDAGGFSITKKHEPWGCITSTRRDLRCCEPSSTSKRLPRCGRSKPAMLRVSDATRHVQRARPRLKAIRVRYRWLN